MCLRFVVCFVDPRLQQSCCNCFLRLLELLLFRVYRTYVLFPLSYYMAITRGGGGCGGRGGHGGGCAEPIALSTTLHSNRTYNVFLIKIFCFIFITNGSLSFVYYITCLYFNSFSDSCLSTRPHIGSSSVMEPQVVFSPTTNNPPTSSGSIGDNVTSTQGSKKHGITCGQGARKAMRNAKKRLTVEFYFSLMQAICDNAECFNNEIGYMTFLILMSKIGMFKKLLMHECTKLGRVIDLSCISTSKRLEERKIQLWQRISAIRTYAKRIGNIFVTFGLTPNIWIKHKRMLVLVDNKNLKLEMVQRQQHVITWSVELICILLLAVLRPGVF